MAFRLSLAALAALVALALVAPSAPASARQESIIEDSRQFVELGAGARERALNDAAALGADAIRQLVIWSRVAPSPDATARPAFDGADPGAYPPSVWDRYDDLVRGAQARSLGVLLTPTTPAPAWASGCSKRRATRILQVCKPKSTQFAEFVAALGTRYSGTYPDENQGAGVLPRVTRWSIGNEPNQKGWLYPQLERRGGAIVGTAAIIYRRMANEAIAALRATGHAGDQILLAETAPIGRVTGTLGNRNMAPGLFLRELLCMDAAGRRLTGAAARLRSCERFTKLAVTGYAHHPYTKGGFQPPRASVLRDEITVATATRLKRLLDGGARLGRVPRRLPIFYTEFGFQTDPPDSLGVTLDQQARYLNEADYIAFRDSRVKSVSQYKLVDDENIASFQTGLRTAGFAPKPAYAAWRLPIHVIRSGSRAVRVYGQVRPAPDSSSEQVQIQRRASADDEWETERTLRVRSLKGHFLVKVQASGGFWRLRWAPSAGGATLLSREATVARR